MSSCCVRFCLKNHLWSRDEDIDRGNKEDYSEYDTLSASKEQGSLFARLLSYKKQKLGKRMEVGVMLNTVVFFI